MNHGDLASDTTRPRHSFGETPWVVGYDGATGADPGSALASVDEFIRLLRIGAVPALITSDGDRRVGVGGKGWSRWLDLIAPFASGGVAYARMAARTTLLAWSFRDVTWNMRFEIQAGGSRPSVFGAIDELDRRLSVARRIVEAAASPRADDDRLEILSRRGAVMAAASAQSDMDPCSTWHQDERILGGMNGMASAPEGSLRLSEEGRRALDALPSVLHVEHRKGMNPLKSRRTEILNLYAPVSLCLDPGDPMERLRALTTIPEGEVWWTR